MTKINVMHFGGTEVVPVRDRLRVIVNNQFTMTDDRFDDCDDCGIKHELNILEDLECRKRCPACIRKYKDKLEQYLSGLNNENFRRKKQAYWDKIDREIARQCNKNANRYQKQHGVAITE